MMRKPRRSCFLSSIVPLIAVVIVMALAVRAQVKVQLSDKSYGVSVTPGVGAPSLRFERGGTNVRSAVLPQAQQAEHSVVALDENPPFFLPAVSYDSGGVMSESVVIADLNLDSKPDLVVANECVTKDCPKGSVSVLLGNGDGTFLAPVTYDSGEGNAMSVAVADIDMDGKPDLVVANLNSNTVSVLLGKGDGTFQSPVAYHGFGGWSVAVADTNGDGKPDLVATDSGYVGVALGNGDGTFQSPVFFDPGGAWSMSVSVADVNRDYRPDLIVGSWCVSYDNCASGAVGVLLGNGDGTFQPTRSYSSGGPYGWAVVIADLNGNGTQDVLVTNYEASTVGVLLGNDDGTFQSVATYSVRSSPVSLSVADVNGDGKVDLLVGDDNLTTVSILLGNGNGTMQLPLDMDSGGWSSHSMAVADLNGDNKPDLVVANLCASHSDCGAGGAIGVLLNSTNRSASTTTLVSSRNPVAPHDAVRYTATVTSQYGGAVTGTVTFQDAGTTIATVTLANRQAVFSTKYSVIGTHAITATYSGDADSSSSTSATLTENIEFPSKTSITTSSSPTFVGHPVTFMATVTSAYGAIPDGELVTFYDGTTTMASVALAGGTASYTTSALSAKTHAIKATYAGDTKFLPSTATVTQLVVKYSTVTALVSNPDPSAYAHAVTFTATVTSTGPYPPTGKVWFKDGTTVIAAVTLTSGAATLTRKWLAVGTHPMKAQYLGDAYSAKSTSSVLNQTVH